MRVFYVCADRGVPPDGTKGASVHFRSLAATLQEAGHEVTALMRAPARNGVPFPTPLLPFSGGESLLAAADAVGPPDLVCERYALGATQGLLASRQLGVPFALEVNAPLVTEATRHRPDTVDVADTESERRLFREADLVLAVSEPLRRYVAELRGGDAGTAVLHNGCDPRRFLARWGRTNDSTRVLAFLGHPKPWHGAGQLVPLLADLLADGYDVRLLVIGGGEGATELERQAQRHGVRDRLEVTGAVDPSAVGTLLARATVGLAPYGKDPFFYFCPLKVIEYMAAGLPAVTAAQGDLPEIIGDAGLLVPPGEPQAVGGAVRTLLDDPLLCRTLGDRARARVLDRYTWPKTARRLVELTAPLVESPPSVR